MSATASNLKTFGVLLPAMRRCGSILLSLVVAGSMQEVSSAADHPFDAVASIFARHCVRCHNEIDREGGFSLATAESVFSSDIVQPGDASSHLLELIRDTGDESPSMPKDADPLSDDDVATIRKWVVDGARWPAGRQITEGVSDFDWWSFRPVRQPAVPSMDHEWVRTPIDAFIAARHQKLGLTPAPAADRRTLIRRLTYDLIGLPPTPADVDAFVADPDPLAYERLVQRLLASKHYGERWARHWLDVVKYADTCGYDKDKLRPNAWPYRDYVIRSLNDDKPYGRFVQEQIAGDALFPGEPDGILGLGFIAAGPWDFIGHVEVAESKIDGKVARNLDRDEMVTNTINTFCSVTVQCARCHNHKFDPFTQEHYYSLQSIFAAVDRADRPYDLDPEVEKQRRDLGAELKSWNAQLKALEKEIADAGGARLTRLKKRVGELAKKVGVTKQPEFGYHSQIEKSAEAQKWVEVDLGREVPIENIVLRPCHDDFGGIGSGFGFPPSYEVVIRRDAALPNQPAIGATSLVTATDVANPGLKPVAIDAGGKVARFIRVTATRLAHRKNDYIFALAELQALDTQGRNLALGADVRALDSIEAPVRWRRSNLVDGVWARSSDPEAGDELATAEQELAEMVASIETPQRKERRSQLDRAISQTQSRLDALPRGKLVYAAATHFKTQGNFKPTEGKLRPVQLLHRGNIQQPQQTVSPGLLPTGAGDDWRLDSELSESERRAVLARWLTRSDHPLVWRSIVNRVWLHHFGQGLVATPNDFGRMGAEPTHPRLLDWLAANFRSGDQSLKQLHRLIVTSSVYRQSSTFDGGNAAIDGSNQFLWKMNRRRLSAEEIRDSILAVSGALDTKMGGPGFYLFELEKTEHSPHYEYHKFDPADPASHRRSIYRFVVRSQPDPYMTTLDCADSSQSTPKRIETLTSLQALSLLNSRFNLEMSRRFAGRLRSEARTLGKQVDRAMMLVAGRLPSEEERSELVHYAEEHGLENLCRMMLNLSEFVFLD